MQSSPRQGETGGGGNHDRFGSYCGSNPRADRQRGELGHGSYRKAPNPQGRGAPQIKPNRLSDPRTVGSNQLPAVRLHCSKIIREMPLISREKPQAKLQEPPGCFSRRPPSFSLSLRDGAPVAAPGHRRRRERQARMKEGKGPSRRASRFTARAARKGARRPEPA